jgi:hypothetical protein
MGEGLGNHGGMFDGGDDLQGATGRRPLPTVQKPTPLPFNAKNLVRYEAVQHNNLALFHSDGAEWGAKATLGVQCTVGVTSTCRTSRMPARGRRIFNGST